MHDQSWTNYIVPLQLAAQRDLYKKQPSEVVHWVLYEPPYKSRWKDDSFISKKEKKEDDGYHLHSIRKKHADTVLLKGSSNYINRIQASARKNGVTYKGINTPDEFWQYLKSFSDNSISRVWYSGHASKSELMLALTHNSACKASAFIKDTINKSDISTQKSLENKFSKSSLVSKFYGCYTEGFAKEWKATFNVSTAGAKNKIDFGVVQGPSSIVNVMERIETTPTSVGRPDWTVH